MKEDKISINLMELNGERIQYKYIADRKNKFRCKIDNLKWLLKYVCLGDLDYALFRLSEKLRSMNRLKDQKENCLRTISESDRIAVFTVIFGDYDVLKDPLYITPNCDYYVLTNNPNVKSEIWENYELSPLIMSNMKGFSNLEMARCLKVHPQWLFPDYKYSIFVDGNVQIVTDMRPIVAQLGENYIAIHKQPGRDCVYQEATEIIARKKAEPHAVKKQVNQYKNEGFPKHYGMFQTNVVVREHNNPKCIDLMNTWWKEIEAHTKRDQLSFTYALWKNGLDKANVSPLGDNTDTNPRFKVSSHI